MGAKQLRAWWGSKTAKKMRNALIDNIRNRPPKHIASL